MGGGRVCARPGVLLGYLAAVPDAAQTGSLARPLGLFFHFVEGRYLAACREFVIPAEAGIQRARLDSVSSTE